MNPLTSTDNESAEAARARQLAELVHKNQLGVHTKKANESGGSNTKVFDTQKVSSGPSLEEATKNILQGARLTDPVLERNEREAKMLESEVTRQAQEANKAPETPKPVERIGENQSLTNQSAILHTFTQDVESLVKDRKVSMVRAVALEADKDPRMAQFAQEPAHKISANSLLMLLAGLCAVFAVGILGVTFYIRTINAQQKAVEIPKARYDASLIFFEHSQPFDVTDLESYELIGGLAHLRDTVPSSLGSMTSIDMYETAFDPVTNRRAASALTLPTFITNSKFNLPDQLSRALSGNYMVVVHQGEKPTPIMLLQASEPDAAFAGMLRWEKNMASNLSPLFPLGTLTLAEAPPEFSDLSFNNIDARVLYDGNQNIVVLYALLERNVVAITNSLVTMQEVASRLHTQRLKK